MNTRPVRNKFSPEYLELAAGKAVCVNVRRGALVRCLRGRVWVTQDGDVRDYSVPPGSHYRAGNRGRIVVSAMGESSRIAVYRNGPRPAGSAARNEVRTDTVLHDTLESAAQQAMAETSAAMVRNGWHLLQQAWRRFVQARMGAEKPLRLRAQVTITDH